MSILVYKYRKDSTVPRELVAVADEGHLSALEIALTARNHEARDACTGFSYGYERSAVKIFKGVTSFEEMRNI
jgi:hypothetical protein